MELRSSGTVVIDDATGARAARRPPGTGDISGQHSGTGGIGGNGVGADGGAGQNGADATGGNGGDGGLGGSAFGAGLGAAGLGGLPGGVNGIALPGFAGTAGTAGQGIGGGVYLDPGETAIVDNTTITGNHASTSNNGFPLQLHKDQSTGSPMASSS